MPNTDEPLLRTVFDLDARQKALEAADPVRPVALYTTDAEQSIPSGAATFTVVDFEDQVKDPLGLVTTGASWQFEAPFAGVYLVAASVTFASSSAWAVGEVCSLHAYVNGSERAVLSTGAGNNDVAFSVGGAALVYLDAGDKVDIRARQASGGARTLSAAGTGNYAGIAQVM